MLMLSTYHFRPTCRVILFLSLSFLVSVSQAADYGSALQGKQSQAIKEHRLGSPRVIHSWSEQSLHLRSTLMSEPDASLKRIIAAESEFLSPESQAEYQLLLAEAYANLVMFNKTLEHVEQGLTLVSKYPQPWLTQYFNLYKAEAFDQLGETQKGIELTQEAIEWADQSNDYELLFKAHIIRGIQHLTLGQNESAMANFQVAKELSETHSLETEVAAMAYYKGLVYEYTLQDELALNEYTKVRDAFIGTQNKVMEVKAIYGMGRSSKNVGKLEEGAALLQLAAAKAEEIGFWQYSAYANKELSGYYLQKQQADEAIIVLEKARELFLQSGNPYMLMDVNFTLGRVGLQKQDLEMADKHLRLAQNYVTGDSMVPHQLSLDYAKMELLRLQGNTEEALMALKKLYGDYRRFTRKQNIDKLLELTTLYELKEKEALNRALQEQTETQEILIQQRQQIYVYASIAGAVLVLSLLLLYLNSKRHRRKLQELYNTDSLTKVSSRSYTLKRLEEEVSRAKRHRYEVSLASIDIDFFKHINDQFGHGAGDKVLIEFGQICLQHFRASDIVGRVGGEEFLVCLPHTSKVEAEKALRSFINILGENPVINELKGSPLTASIGLVQIELALPLNDNLVRADKALYEAKDNGRNNIIVG
jgi:diguanylate cyclase (GGDEF)-like protein